MVNQRTLPNSAEFDSQLVPLEEADKSDGIRTGKVPEQG